MRDRLGNIVTEDEARALLARERPGRRAKRKDPEPAGYAWPPGTGPAGETCGSCRHLYRNRQAKTYLKCELVRAKWTGGRKTDVLARSLACAKWEGAE